MPDRIARLKAKLLGRLSPKADTDPSVHPTSNKSPAYSIVSATPELAIDQTEPQEPVSSVSAEQLHREGTRDCTPSLTEPYNSTLPTPLSGDPPSPLATPPLPTQHSDNTSFQSNLKTALSTEPQLTPALNTVVEGPNDRQPSAPYFTPSSSKRPSLAIRRQSLLPATHRHLVSGLLEASLFSNGDDGRDAIPAVPYEMVQRRVWVKRPGGSATLVPCMEDAVVDELRDQVIMKYVNSLGRSFDSPDIVIRIAPREGSNRQAHPERLLSPEEVLSSILDSYYPGGQRIEEALMIDAPTRRTPKPSPRHVVYSHHQSEPGEHGDYFPLMPPNPNMGTPSAHPTGAPATVAAPSISILSTGSAPQLPSPGNRRSRHHQRPPLTRHKTNSPTVHSQSAGLLGEFENGHNKLEQPLIYHRILLPCPTSLYSLRPSSTNTPSTAGGRIPSGQGQDTYSSGRFLASVYPKIKSRHLPICGVRWFD